MKKFENGDEVKIHDPSYSQCIGKMFASCGIKKSDKKANGGGIFTIVEILESEFGSPLGNIHDVIIRGPNGDFYLHSLRFLRRHNPIKEVTMADLEEKYGCKVKVIK